MRRVYFLKDRSWADCDYTKTGLTAFDNDINNLRLTYVNL